MVTQMIHVMINYVIRVNEINNLSLNTKLHYGRHLIHYYISTKILNINKNGNQDNINHKIKCTQ